MKTTDGGQAFPASIRVKDWNFGGKEMEHLPGMTLRDWFAGMALQGLLAMCAGAHVNSGDNIEAARVAYMHADAMLAERSK